MSEGTSRRRLLIASAWGMLAGGAVLTARLVGAAIGGRPRASRRLLAIGPVRALAEGGVLRAGEVIVFHDERGIAAVSSRCTHLGCTVTVNARGFECPCHGSVFSRDGRVIQGPATSALPWYEVLLGDDGELRVNLDRTVDPMARLRLEST